MGLLQRDVAARIGVTQFTILNWEKGHTEAPINIIPAIVQFLGYDPFPSPVTLAEHILAKRRKMGWSIKHAAAAVGVDPAIWRRWKTGIRSSAPDIERLSSQFATTLPDSSWEL